MSEKIVGRLVVEFIEGRDPRVTFVGTVDPNNFVSLMYHVRMAYSNLSLALRDEELKNVEVKKKLEEEARGKAIVEREARIRLQKELEARAKKKADEDFKLKQAEVLAENRKLEAERILRIEAERKAKAEGNKEAVAWAEKELAKNQEPAKNTAETKTV